MLHSTPAQVFLVSSSTTRARESFFGKQIGVNDWKSRETRASWLLDVCLKLTLLLPATLSPRYEISRKHFSDFSSESHRELIKNETCFRWFIWLFYRADNKNILNKKTSKGVTQRDRHWTAPAGLKPVLNCRNNNNCRQNLLLCEALSLMNKTTNLTFPTSEDNQSQRRSKKSIFTVDFVYFGLTLRNCIIGQNKWVIKWWPVNGVGLLD